MSSLRPLSQERSLVFEQMDSNKIVRKLDHIANLERRQKALEDEVSEALSHCSPDDLMVVDLKRRILHLRAELKRLRNHAVRERSLH